MAHTGTNPLRKDEFLAFRTRVNYSQTEAAAAFDVHSNTWARWERGQLTFPHPAMFRFAVEQYEEDFAARRVTRLSAPLRLAVAPAVFTEVREGLSLTFVEFGALLDAVASTVRAWELGAAEFPHPAIFRLAARCLYGKRGLVAPASLAA